MRRGVLKATPKVKPVGRAASPQKPQPRARSPLKQEISRTPAQPIRKPVPPSCKKAILKPVVDQGRAPRSKARATPIPSKSDIEETRQLRQIEEPPKPVQPPPKKPTPPPKEPEPEEPTSIDPMPPIGTEAFHKDFMATIEICKKLCKFENPEAEKPEITRKLTALARLLKFVAERDNCMSAMSPEEVDELFDMIRINIFRPMQVNNPKDLFWEVPPPLFEKTWPHLDVLYLMMFRIHCLAPHDPHFNEDFLNSLFEVCATADFNERRELIHFFKSFIVRHDDLRPFLMKKVLNLIHQHTVTMDRPFQVATVLPILIGLCENEEEDLETVYKNIEKYVLPLIGDTFVFYFNLSLGAVLDFFTDERPDNAFLVVQSIAKHWPVANNTKLAVYTTMIIEYFPRMTIQAQDKLVRKVFSLLASGCNAPSPKVAEASFQIFLAPDFDEIMWRNCDQILQIMVPAVTKCITSYWEPSIREIAGLCMAILTKFGPSIVNNLKIKSLTVNEEDDDASKEFTTWNLVLAAANENDSEIDKSAKEKELEDVFNTPTYETPNTVIPSSSLLDSFEDDEEDFDI